MFESFHACNSCINRRVELYTVNGDIHRGTIVGVDEQNVYLDTAGEAIVYSVKKQTGKGNRKGKVKTSAFFGFGRGAITTLALFDLLAIVLII